MKLNRVALIAASSAGLMIATGAFAAPTDTSTTVATAHVSLNDLNLATEAGLERMYARLRAASQSVCGRADIRDLKAVGAENACIARALAGAVEQVNAGRATRLASL
jgi:UrcA family protein